MRKLKGAFVGDAKEIDRVYGMERRLAIASRLDLVPGVLTASELAREQTYCADIEVLLSTWGMPKLDSSVVASLRDLKLVLYAAGDVRGFAQGFVDNQVPIVSAWRANAVPVVEFTLAHILLAGKAYLRNVEEYRNQKSFSTAVKGDGNFGQVISVLGVGAIGKQLIRRLQAFDFQVLVYDPHVSAQDASELNVIPVSLMEAFEKGTVVTNHLGDNSQTKELLTRDHFSQLKPGSTFINTGRGQTVRNPDFTDVFGLRPDLTAVLDVTHPEPLPADSPIWSLRNVFVSTHIAGSIGSEVGRMADLCIAELDRFLKGEPLQHLVDPSLLLA